MKISALVMMIVLMVFIASGQTEKKWNRLHGGFYGGANYSNLLSAEKLPEQTKIVNGTGFNLGIFADINVREKFILSPKAELSVYQSKVEFTNSVNQITEYHVAPVCLGLKAHAKLLPFSCKKKPYLLVGPGIQLPLSKSGQTTTSFRTKSDVTADFGVGIEFPTACFTVFPELRYSYGLCNVNTHPALKSLNMHSLSLLLNFK